MMGLNCTIRIWESKDARDDRVGGAIPNDVPLESFRARVEANQPTQALLEQGFETVKLVTCIAEVPKSYIREGFLVEVVSPVDHPFYAKTFYVLGVQYDSRINGHVQLTCQRVEETRRLP